ncbi:MAG: sugar transferase [Acidimicrobiia bacterium]
MLAPIELDDLLWQRIGVFIRRTPYERIGKPVLDRVVALLLLILLSPVLAAALLWVRPQIGPGGAFFRQQRIGLGGRPFTIYKVRTMQVDRRLGAGGYGGPDRRSEHKTAADPRHTPRGTLLRRLSIDELPQLWNVVRGDMSLVGPRPELAELVERHRLHGHPRHRVKPGLTGPWQVSPDRSEPLVLHLARDVAYLTRITFWGDAAILARTVLAVARGAGR